ncbi:luc7-like protein 3 [Eurosta solidaginis]|uniref:luc7-like protein 3 n=1 Tax=Eurosta solidaginis TaxID=178769 RepID=UPI003530624D
MVDAARQMLDELMGRNRNLHPSEAPRKITWDDPDFCQYYVVKFCPHDLFINTRADLGPCMQIHDDEAKRLYEEARPSARKRSYEDEFLRFCNNMLNDVDRKIQKGKQRLLLMNRDQPAPVIPISKYQEQMNNVNARIKKLLTEAEEAGIRGDVDQAKDLMALCEQLKDEKDALAAHHEQQLNAPSNGLIPEPPEPPLISAAKPETEKSPKKEEAGNASSSIDKKIPPWMQEFGTLPEKQMEVCETCGAFLIVGDAQQRIEDHLMGKQHLGYSRLRQAVEEIQERRQKEREEEDKKRHEEREHRSSTRSYSQHNERRRDHSDRDRERERDRDHRARSRDHSNRHSSDRHRHHHKSSHHRRSHSRSSHRRGSRDRHSRSRSRSHSHSRSHSRY